MIIYKVTNISNNKIYIGKTIQDFEKYKRTHISNALNNVDSKYGRKPRVFYNAIRKHGYENFEWEILEICQNKNELNEKEIFYIEKYNSYSTGYNMTKGGDGGNGTTPYIRNEEIKEKISLSLKGHKRSQESIQKQIKSMSGENHPLFGIGHKKESIEKMKKSKTGKNNPMSKCFKITSPNGELFIIHGKFIDFCLQHHLWHNALSDVAKGKKSNHKGWLCEEINQPSCS